MEVSHEGTEMKAVFTRDEVREKLGIDLRDFYNARLHPFPETETLEFYFLENPDDAKDEEDA